MSLKTKLVSSLLSLTIAAGAIAGTVEQSAAKKLPKGEVAAIAGVGGFILGAAIAAGNRGPEYYEDHGYGGSWEAHVNRCYARYNSYDHRTDTFIGYDGYEHRCRPLKEMIHIANQGRRAARRSFLARRVGSDADIQGQAANLILVNRTSQGTGDDGTRS